MIAFTVDIDWACEAVIEDTLQFFEDYQVKCTLFVTHPSEVIRRCNRELFEIAIHPNFNPLLQGKSEKSVDQILDELLGWYPEAKGVRSHSLADGSFLLYKFAEKKLLYDANLLMPYQENIKPFKYMTGSLRIPYNWEDDVHWTYGHSFDNPVIKLTPESYNVLDFHPIHIFLNSENDNRYQLAKPFNQDAEKLLSLRNKSTTKGARDFLIYLLEYVKTASLISKKLIEIYEEYK